jgi:hypothetical protein
LVLVESGGGFPNRRMSDSNFWLELEASHDGKTLFG